MADTKLKVRGEDDYISHFGSISGETFASRRSRRDCTSLRRTSIDSLAKNLREYHSYPASPDGDEQYDIGRIVSGQKRFNKSFHNFRLLVVMMSGMSVGLMLVLRYNISIAILRMVNQTHMYLEEHPNKTVDDFLDEGYSLGGEFNWNNEIIQIIMSWYMVTCTLPQIPAAKLTTIIGCRWSVPVTLSICAISSILTPYSAYMGWEYVVALRMINGLGASAVLPVLLNLVEIWMRYNEISYGLTMAQIVIATMSALTPLIAGYLSSIHWSLAFYVPGAVTLVFCALWLILVADSPEQSRFISEKELLHILSVESDEEKSASEAASVANNNDSNNEHNDRAGGAEQDKKAVVSRKEEELEYQAESWVQIFKVPSFYAYIVIWIIYDSSFSGFTFVLPTYLRQFLKIKIAQNGFYCFLITSGSILAAVWPHPLLRMLQNCGLSITHSRILSNALCSFVVAATWFYVGAFHEYQLVLLFLNRAFHPGNDIILCGSLMSNYAKAGMSSVAFALVNTLGNLSIVPTCTLIGWTLDYTNQSRMGWFWIFLCLSLSQIVMFAIFAIFVDSNPIKFKKSAQQKDVELSRKVNVDNTQRDSNKTDTKRRPNNFDEMKKAVEKTESKLD